MSISSNTNNFWLFLFLQQRHQPQEDRIQKFLFMMLPFTLNVSVIRAHTVGNYAPLIINV